MTVKDVAIGSSRVGNELYPLGLLVVEPGSVKTVIVYDQFRRRYRVMPKIEVPRPMKIRIFVHIEGIVAQLTYPDAFGR